MGFSRDAGLALSWGVYLHGRSAHRRRIRHAGKGEVRAGLGRALSTTTDQAVSDATADGPADGFALPEWAEELRGCDLPRCPVCELARRGYLEAPNG